MRTYIIKRKEDGWEYFDEFQASCWYEAQKVFTDKIRVMVVGKYVRFEFQSDADQFGVDFKGPGLYPIRDGDNLIDGVIYNTFFDGVAYYTIRVVQQN